MITMEQEWKSNAYSSYVSAFKGKQSIAERQASVNRLHRLMEPVVMRLILLLVKVK